MSSKNNILDKEKIPTLSLFTGAGGLDIGFHNAGFDIVGCVEIDPIFTSTLIKNRGKCKYISANTNVHCIDIRKFDPNEYLNMGIECVIGGPPCQPFSAAGRRSGGVPGIEDFRGKLFEAYCYILKVLKPKVFVFENVYGLTGANGGDPWQEIVKSFSVLGYQIHAEIIDAADYGVPQHRERLFIVGSLSGQFIFPEPTNGPDSSSHEPLITIWDAIKDLQDSNEPEHDLGGLYGHLLPLVPEGLNYSFFTKEMGYPEPYFAWRSKFHDFLYKADRNKPSRTIKAQPGKFTGPFHWKNRHFTIEELKRIQTFPDDYELCGSYSQVMAQIGNSVPPKLAHILAIAVKEQLLRARGNFTYKVRSDNFVSTFRRRQRETSLYYKKLAENEVAKRFENSPNNRILLKTKESYMVSYSDLFSKRIIKDHDKNELGSSAFSVSSIVESSNIAININHLISNNVPSIIANIQIEGLKKYLINIDTVSVVARLLSIKDMFAVWDIVQEQLVRISKFFSLIDIYGHYANRGDTVKIKTSFKCNDNSLLVRAISYFGSSENCGYFLSRDQVAKSIGVNVLYNNELVFLMRELRYDVRTNQTHSTIRTDDILCTYPFPMLSDKVQFDRKVETNNL